MPYTLGGKRVNGARVFLVSVVSWWLVRCGYGARKDKSDTEATLYQCTKTRFEKLENDLLPRTLLPTP